MLSNKMFATVILQTIDFSTEENAIKAWQRLLQTSGGGAICNKTFIYNITLHPSSRKTRGKGTHCILSLPLLFQPYPMSVLSMWTFPPSNMITGSSPLHGTNFVFACRVSVL